MIKKFVMSLIEVKLGKRNLSLRLRVEQAVRPIVRGYHAYLPRELAVINHPYMLLSEELLYIMTLSRKLLLSTTLVSLFMDDAILLIRQNAI